MWNSFTSFRTVLALVVLSIFCYVPTLALNQNRLILLHPGTVINTETTSAVKSGFNLKSLFDSSSKQLYLVHVKEDLKPSERHAIESALGTSLKNYLPHNTYLCALSDPIAAQTVEGVLWVGEYHKSYKTLGLPQRFLSTDEQQNEESIINKSQSQSKSVMVLLPEGADEVGQNILISLQHKFGAEFGSVSHANGEYVVVTVHSSDILPAVVQALSEHPMVAKVEPKVALKMLNRDASWVSQSNVANKYSIHDKGIHGEGQIIGVADTGIDYDHCMFNDASHSVTFNSTNSQHRKILGYYYYSETDTSDEVDGHGTHVVGSIAGEAVYSASATNQSAAAAFNGVAYKSKIVFTDIMKEGGSIYTPTDISVIFASAYDLGARIHSNSWGCSADDPTDCNIYESMARYVDKFMWDYPDMLVLFAAGNDGDSGSNTVGTPATAKNCLTVGATRNDIASFNTVPNYLDVDSVLPVFCDYYNSQRCPTTNNCCVQTEAFCCQQQFVSCCRSNFELWTIQKASVLKTSNLAEFSSRGPGSKSNPARIKPDVTAPGERIVSAHSDGNTNTFQCGTSSPSLSNDAALLALEGTSMATPITAGSVALVRQYFTDGYYPTGSKNSSNAMTSVPSSLLKAMLVASAVDLSYYTDNSWTNSKVIPSSPNNFTGFGRILLDNVLRFSGSSQYDLFVAEKNKLEGGSAHTYNFTVTRNDLPMRVVLAYNDYYSLTDTALVNNLDLFVTAPNGVITWGNGVSGGDSNNVIERAIYTAPAVGNYTIVVRGTRVGFGPQPYALVVTGGWSSTSSATPSPTAAPSTPVTPSTSLASHTSAFLFSAASIILVACFLMQM